LEWGPARGALFFCTNRAVKLHFETALGQSMQYIFFFLVLFFFGGIFLLFEAGKPPVATDANVDGLRPVMVSHDDRDA